MKQHRIYPCGDDPTYFRTISAGHKGIMKSLATPGVPVRREWNQSLNIKSSNSSCRTNAMVTGLGGGVHLHFTHFLPFILQPSEVSPLCYVESQKKD